MAILVEKEKAVSVKVCNAKELKVLLDENRWKIARMLAEGADYPTNISRRLKLPEQLVHYHIKQLQKAELVKIEKIERIQGATTRFFSLTAPAFAVVAGNEWNTFRTSKKPPKLFEEFIENGKLNCKIVVGSPDSHGPQKQRARDMYHGIDLALLLGSYCTDIDAATWIDTEIKEKDLADNIICVGGPIANLITERFTRNAPIRFKGRELVSTLSKKTYLEASNGLILKTNNPLDRTKKVLVFAGKSSPGSRAAILTVIRHPNMDFSNKYNKKFIAKVVEGLDLDGDGIVDEIEVKE